MRRVARPGAWTTAVDLPALRDAVALLEAEPEPVGTAKPGVTHRPAAIRIERRGGTDPALAGCTPGLRAIAP